MLIVLMLVIFIIFLAFYRPSLCDAVENAVKKPFGFKSALLAFIFSINKIKVKYFHTVNAVFIHWGFVRHLADISEIANLSVETKDWEINFLST